MFTQLHLLALVCYGLTGALVAAPLLRLSGAGGGGPLPLAMSASAVAVHFGALLAYARAAGTVPLTGLAPALSSLAFLVGLLALAIQWLTRERAIALVAAPLVIVLLTAALAAGFGPPPPPARASGIWFILHVGASLLGLALVAVAFAASALYLLQHRELKARRFGAIFQVLPPLEQLDRLNHVALVIGFPTLTLGVALALGYLGLGAPAAGVGPGHLGWGLFSWAVLGVVTAARVTRWLYGRRAALGSILAFATIASGYMFLMLIEASNGAF